VEHRVTVVDAPSSRTRRFVRVPALLVVAGFLATTCGGSSPAGGVDSSHPSPHDDAGSQVDSGTARSGVRDGSSARDALANDASRSTSTDGASAPTHWIPAEDTTFYWDLSNADSTVDNTVNVGAYDIDGWNNSASEVAVLHARGLKVVCYMDVGTYEPDRPDSTDFPASLLGNGVQGWPGEYWLDVRPSSPNYAKLQAIMLARFRGCRSKGFDGVEPDNIDSFDGNDPGFPTTAADQLAYDEWVAETVHSLGLAVFQKNDTGQVADLVASFDGELDEECNKYSECATLAPYTAAHKPIWNAEYQEDGETTGAFCPADDSANIAGALLSLNLDGSLFQPCPDDVGLHN